MISQTVTSAPPKTASGIPEVLQDCVNDAVIETFGKICGDAAPYLLDDESKTCDGIVGIISFVGDYTWSLILGLPHDAAVSIAKKFAGFEIEFDSPDMGDVIGELANVLAGVVNGKLETAGIRAFMSLPTVACGHDVHLLLPGNLLTQWLHFATMDVDFWVKLVVARRS